MSREVDSLTQEVGRFVLRDVSTRPVTIVRKDGSTYVLPWVEVVKKLHRLEFLESELAEGEPQRVCPGWEGRCPNRAVPGPEAMRPAKKRSRKGEPWRCLACAKRRSHALVSANARSEIVKKGHASKSAAQRSAEAIRRINKTSTDNLIASRVSRMSHEQRSEMSRRGHETKRKNRARKS